MEKKIVISSNIASIWYDDINNVLEVAFINWSVYQYFNVPGSEYDWIIKSSSHWSYLHENIKGNYEYKHVI